MTTIELPRGTLDWCADVDGIRKEIKDIPAFDLMVSRNSRELVGEGINLHDPETARVFLIATSVCFNSIRRKLQSIIQEQGDEPDRADDWFIWAHGWFALCLRDILRNAGHWPTSS